MATSKGNDDQWRDLEAEIKPSTVLPSLSGIDAAQLGPMLGIYGLQPGRNAPDYLFPRQHQRSLFQQMTLNCGMGYGSGLVTGGVIGTIKGLKSKDATNFKLKLNAVLNGASKRGTSLANSFGTIALFYTCFSNALQTAREKSDVYNEIGGAVLTGLIYKSTRGIRTATAAGVLAGSALGIFNTIRHHLSKSGHGSISQLLPKLS